MENIKALLIDPENREVSEIEILGQQGLIHEVINSLFLTRVEMSSGDGLYINSEGVLNTDIRFISQDMPAPAFFQIEGFRPYCGKSLVIGSKAGELQSPAISLRALKSKIKFFTEEETFKYISENL